MRAQGRTAKPTATGSQSTAKRPSTVATKARPKGVPKRCRRPARLASAPPMPPGMRLRNPKMVLAHRATGPAGHATNAPA